MNTNDDYPITIVPFLHAYNPVRNKRISAIVKKSVTQSQATNLNEISNEQKSTDVIEKNSQNQERKE